MGKMSRDKGKVGEREIAAILKENGFADARRGVQYKGGAGSPDVVGLPGIHIEVKRVEALQLWPAMEQAKAEAAVGEMPVVLHRKNNKPWVAILPLEDFLRMRQERAALQDMLRTALDQTSNPPVIVKEQPEDSDWEKLKDENRRLRAALDERNGANDDMPDLTKINWNEEFERG